MSFERVRKNFTICVWLFLVLCTIYQLLDVMTICGKEIYFVLNDDDHFLEVLDVYQ